MRGEQDPWVLSDSFSIIIIIITQIPHPRRYFQFYTSRRATRW